MLALLSVAVPQPSVYAQMDGLKGNIVAAIAVDRRPVVTFAITDAKGKPIDLVDLDVNSVKFTIAALRLSSAIEDFVSYHLRRINNKRLQSQRGQIATKCRLGGGFEGTADSRDRCSYTHVIGAPERDCSEAGDHE